MKVQIEGVILSWADEIPNIIVRVINAISIAENKEELQTALLQISQETEFDKFFVLVTERITFGFVTRKIKSKVSRAYFFYHLLFSNTCDNIY